MHLNMNFKAIMHALFGEVHMHSKGCLEQNSLTLVLLTRFSAGIGHFSIVKCYTHI